VTAVENVGYYTRKGLDRKIAGAPVGYYTRKRLDKKIAGAPPRSSTYFSIQTFPCIIPHILNLSHTSYLLAYEDGTDRMFRNIGI
jgi:hypothetical protein